MAAAVLKPYQVFDWSGHGQDILDFKLTGSIALYRTGAVLSTQNTGWDTVTLKNIEV